ncbi:hypothetical protein DL96DRAFT_1716333 [Flagelloscypha sp. PMI_526]|nr:hypothetical protein DL96DRAFT_1716333 [Flagelloscypha sp. PMI_526]
MPCPRASQSDREAIHFHLLDPAYTSTSPSTKSKSSALTSVYSDCGGHLHSPDFFAFELPSQSHSHIISTKATAQPAQERFAWELEAAALDSVEYEDNVAPTSPASPRRSISSRRSSMDYEYDYSSASPSLDSWSSSPSSFEYEDLPEQEYDSSSSPSSPSSSVDLKKQWLAVSLRVKTKVYRAKKRLSKPT